METDRKPVRILLAEDHYPDVVLIREALEGTGIAYELERCVNGEEAINRVSACQSGECPDLVILDLNLPKVGGFEILKTLRDNLAFADIPVIILTSSNAAADRREAMRMGASAYVSKPVDLDEFIDTVGRTVMSMLGRTRGGSARLHCRPRPAPANRRIAVPVFQLDRHMVSLQRYCSRH